MAKLHEEVIVVKVSKLLKDDTVTSIEAVIQELAGAGALVEVQKA